MGKFPIHIAIIYIRIIKNHEDHMKDMLRGGLEWFCEKKRDWGPYGCKLEGR